MKKEKEKTTQLLHVVNYFVVEDITMAMDWAWSLDN